MVIFFSGACYISCSYVMPFEPGHPYFPPKNGPPAKHGRSPWHKEVALILREQGSAEKVCKFLTTVCLDGIDPITKEPIEYTHRIAAAKMLLERELGQPAQHLLLQAHVKAQLAVRAAEEQARDPYDALDAADLEALESLGRKLGIDPSRVIDEEGQPALTSGEEQSE